MNAPPASKNAIDSGSSVFVMWNFVACGFGYRNAIASAGPRSVTNISPRRRCSAESASHRHRSQTVPSGSVTLAATSSKPVGSTAFGSGGRRAGRRAGRGFRGVGVRRRRDRGRGRIGRRRGERWLVGAGAGAQHQQRDQHDASAARRRRRPRIPWHRRPTTSGSSPRQDRTATWRAVAGRRRSRRPAPTARPATDASAAG